MPIVPMAREINSPERVVEKQRINTRLRSKNLSSVRPSNKRKIYELKNSRMVTKDNDREDLRYQPTLIICPAGNWRLALVNDGVQPRRAVVLSLKFWNGGKRKPNKAVLDSFGFPLRHSPAPRLAAQGP